ncbi:hypothetical protein GCM10022247_10500 [Allokutzneria multivorans]|uniref:Uncharacterized protein n=1 Tax=Allokutzneria multivorans TaxID=1142134 RepID=A0ABP7R7Q2_9PSEU
MEFQQQAAPPAPAHDPLAVALGNASLLGVGYVLAGRRKLAVFTGIVTVLLVVLLGVLFRSTWFEVVVLLWWLFLIAHGWRLAGGRAQRTSVRRERGIALGFAVPVLLIVGLLRVDSAMLWSTVSEARGSGDCARALAALDRMWFGHHVVDAPMTVKGEDTVHACQKLGATKNKFALALTGDVESMKVGFQDSAMVRRDLPGHEQMVDVVLDGFFGGLPTKEPCDTLSITDGLRAMKLSGSVADRSAHTVARVEPAALVGCGDQLMATQSWARARTRYEQLLSQYPGTEFTARAQDGIKRAAVAIELAYVSSLGQSYCSRPAAYSGAAPYGPGVNRSLVYGTSMHSYTSKFPAEWIAKNVSDAVLVLCAGAQDYGAHVKTCAYRNQTTNARENISFHTIAIPLTAYELRTGRQVFQTTVEIGGTSCPFFVPGRDINESLQSYVTPSDDQVRDAFSYVVNE